jgi:hypothetical protein
LIPLWPVVSAVLTVGDVVAVATLGVALLLPASLLLYRGWQHRQRYLLVRDTRPASAATRADRPVLVSGPVTADEAVEAPVSGDHVALVAWSIQDWRDSGRVKAWLPAASGVRHERLRVDGEDGPAAVLPASHVAEAADSDDRLTGSETAVGVDTETTRVELDGFETEVEVPPSETPPDRLTRLQDGLDTIDPGSSGALVDFGRKHGTRRFRERTLTLGDRLTVRGVLSPAPEPGVAPRVTAPEDGTLLLSSLSPGALERRYRSAYWRLFYGPLAVILLVMGVALVGLAN